VDILCNAFLKSGGIKDHYRREKYLVPPLIERPESLVHTLIGKMPVFGCCFFASMDDTSLTETNDFTENLRKYN
jgi:hypothetical protein